MPEQAYPGERHLVYWTAKLREPRFVYVIRAEGDTPIKVGMARRDVKLRMAELQTGNPRKLKLLYVIPGNRQLEWHLHRLAGTRMVGEWFDGPHVEAFLDFVDELGSLMMKAHDLSGYPPNWRLFADWHLKKSRRNGASPTVRLVDVTLISEEEKQRRLKAWLPRR